jgi:20S proteasome subunit beta 5
MRCRLFELSNGKRITVRAAIQILGNIMFSTTAGGAAISRYQMVAEYDLLFELYYCTCDSDRHGAQRSKVFSDGGQ